MISVIVPVYKVEKYLDKCVQSILGQTYKNYELILVDDGSPDRCPEICDNYAKKYSNVRVLHKKNGGLSDARNSGTAIAKGEYITYIDSDDYVTDDYLESLWYLKEKYNAEIVVTGIQTFYECAEPSYKRNKGREYCCSGLKALECMLYQDKIDSSACAMLIPIDIASKNLFPIGKYHEDEFTTYKYYIEVNKVVISTKLQYFYLQRKGSIMHTFGQSSLDELDAADNYVRFCEEKYPQLVSAANSKKFSDYCQVFLSVNNLKEDNTKVYQRVMGFLLKYRRNIIKNRRCRVKNRLAACLLYFGEKVFFFVGNINKRI